MKPMMYFPAVSILRPLGLLCVVTLTTPKVNSAQTLPQTAGFPFDWKAAEAQNYWGYTCDEVEKLFALPIREPEDRLGLGASRVSPPQKPGVPRSLNTPSPNV